jgi:urate oxidase
MTARLTQHRYGKSRVRVMKVLRDGPVHTVKELDVAIALSGDFEGSYTRGDNSKVVPTDTMKNIVHVLAYRELGRQTEVFAKKLAEHMLVSYAQVLRVELDIKERQWQRLHVGGEPHPHSFDGSSRTVATVKVVAEQGGLVMESGLSDLLILKSTASGFEGYPKCEFTTLPEARDRIFATSLTASWRWSAVPEDYSEANRRILRAFIEPFAMRYSPSVQTTLFQMAESALNACDAIDQVRLAAPNKHCLTIPLERFGIERNSDVFLPTDEPHGQIEAVVSRE